MRATTRATVEYYLSQLDLRGDALEIGGFKLSQCAIDLFDESRFTYRDLGIGESDIPDAIVGDATDMRDVIEDESYDVVFTSDAFEHIDRPWLAAKEIARILRPGGYAFVFTLWAWRNHPCPVDYWRFSPECLEFLFDDLTCVETGYDLSERRNDVAGFWPSGRDSVPVDHLGGWRENWGVYGVFTKGEAPELAPFKLTKEPGAAYLRMDTQGRITNPKMLEARNAKIIAVGDNGLDELQTRLLALSSEVNRLSIRLSSVERKRLEQVEAELEDLKAQLAERGLLGRLLGG